MTLTPCDNPLCACHDAGRKASPFTAFSHPMQGQPDADREATPPNQPDTINGAPVSTTGTWWPKSPPARNPA